MILNVAKAFIRRVITLSHKSFKKECLMTAKEILVKNSFPPKIVEQLVHQVNAAAHTQSPVPERSYAFMDQTTIDNFGSLNVTNDPQTHTSINDSIMPPPDANSTTVNPQPIKEKKVYVGMTYIPKLTETLTKQIKKHIPNLCAAPRPVCKVGNLFSDMKEKLRVGQNSLVIYDIPCGGCRKKKGYLGETTWTLDGRCGPPGGHARDLKNIEKNPRATALVHHVATTQHQFDFGEKRILKKVRHQGLLKIHETNQILLHAVNFKKDADHVSPMFYNLLKQSERNDRSRMKSKRKPRLTCLPTPKYKY